jgi:hypothetical protein
VQQLREAFPESCSYRYAILDGDAKFGEDVTELLTASGMKPTRTSPASPWQNGVAERWIGSCRRELLDHLLVLNDAHLRRLIRGYISYYHADRIQTLWRKIHRRCDLFLTSGIHPRGWFPSSAPVACIIDMIGSRRPE